MQKTIAKSVSFIGPGLHSGAVVSAEVLPAAGGHGIVFERSGLLHGQFPARFDRVEQTPLCTRLVNGSGASVSTIEHLMAAFHGLGITNAKVVLSGPELPILDGSALPFVEAFLQVGLREQSMEERRIRILERIRASRGDRWIEAVPTSRPELKLDVTVDFPAPAIGRQHACLVLSEQSFVRKIASHPTFCMLEDISEMRRKGLALGGSRENAVIFDGDRVVNPERLQSPQGPVMHKMLDLLGDIYLFGAKIEGEIRVMKPGHSLNNDLLLALAKHPHAWEVVAPPTPRRLMRRGANNSPVFAAI